MQVAVLCVGEGAPEQGLVERLCSTESQVVRLEYQMGKVPFENFLHDFVPFELLTWEKPR
jgi:hypothetical protein